MVSKLPMPYSIDSQTVARLENYLEHHRPYFLDLLRQMVEINSFSYRRGIPVDLSEHGGGFVFDCRAIHNPGRYEEFKDKNGHDPQVMEFLRTQSEADEFVADAFKLIHKSIDNYLDRMQKALKELNPCM